MAYGQKRTRTETLNRIILKMENKTQKTVDISVVVPLYNEAESLKELHDWLGRVIESMGKTWEMILVDDGSRDGSWSEIERLKEADKEHVHAVRFRRNYGKSPALFVGFERAQGEVVITMDADLQDSPDEVPELYRMITEEGYDLVSGWKKHRLDAKLTKNLPSKLYNWTARKITGIHLHDMNCGLKAYRKEVIKNIEVYGEMHRYIPYLAKNAGYEKIGEKAVQHSKRKYGVSKFGLNRFVHGYLDLLSLWFLSVFGRQPMHFFGLIGSVMFVIGLIAVMVVGSVKLHALAMGVRAPLVTSTPYFYLALCTMIMGVQMFTTGFIGEMISRNAQGRNEYKIKEEI